MARGQPGDAALSHPPPGFGAQRGGGVPLAPPPGFGVAPYFTAVVPETPRLDSSLQKARARLLAKGRRHRPSRSRLRDSASSTEGEEGLDAAVRPPGVGGGRRDLGRARPPPGKIWGRGGEGGSLRAGGLMGFGGGAQGQRGTHLSTPLPPRRVTLRRASSSKSRKEKGSNRLSMGSREASEGPGRPSGSPFLPFSWFSDSARGSASPGSASPAGSPRHEGLSPAKSASQDSPLSDDSPPPSSSPRLPGPTTTTKCSYPYHTLSQSSDEFLDEPPGAAAGWTCRQVGQWLESLNLEQYVEEFSAHGVDGPRLLHLDGAKSPNGEHLVGFQVPQRAALRGRRAVWVLDPPIGCIWLGSKYTNGHLCGTRDLGGF
uniref:Sterile alpha motif domain containing 14 n=1 Tax=Anas zonorhyncha TaxID=75864 RepID=A0A8B9VV77_9AVES